jgi:hypothetical protein
VQESVIIPTYKRGDEKIVVIIEAYHFCEERSKNIMLSKLTPYAEEIIGDHQC